MEELKKLFSWEEIMYKILLSIKPEYVKSIFEGKKNLNTEKL